MWPELNFLRLDRRRARRRWPVVLVVARPCSVRDAPRAIPAGHVTVASPPKNRFSASNSQSRMAGRLVSSISHPLQEAVRVCEGRGSCNRDGAGLTSARPAPSGQLRPTAAPSAAGSGARALQEALAAQVLGDDVFACVSFAFRQRFRSVLSTSATRFAHCCRFLQCSAWSGDRARLRPQRPPMQPLWHTELLFPGPILQPPDPTRPRTTRPGPTSPDPTRPDPTRPRPTRPGTARTRERRQGTSVVRPALQEALAF